MPLSLPSGAVFIWSRQLYVEPANPKKCILGILGPPLGWISEGVLSGLLNPVPTPVEGNAVYLVATEADASGIPGILLIKERAAAKLLHSWPTLCDPMDSSPPGFSIRSLGFSRQEHWSGLPFPSMHESEKWKWSRSTQGLNLSLLHCRRILYHWATGLVKKQNLNSVLSCMCVSSSFASYLWNSYYLSLESMKDMLNLKTNKQTYSHTTPSYRFWFSSLERGPGITLQYCLLF